MTTAINSYHRQVLRWLSEAGVPYAEEYPAGPYSIDIYLPDLRRGIELDGPWHSPARDVERDRLIFDWFEIPIVRIKVGTRKEQCMEAMLGNPS